MTLNLTFFYHQIDGASVDSSLASILANLFIYCHEKDWIEEAQIMKIILYKRSVDDVLAMFDSKLDAETF